MYRLNTMFNTGASNWISYREVVKVRANLLDIAEVGTSILLDYSFTYGCLLDYLRKIISSGTSLFSVGKHARVHIVGRNRCVIFRGKFRFEFSDRAHKRSSLSLRGSGIPFGFLWIMCFTLIDKVNYNHWRNNFINFIDEGVPPESNFLYEKEIKELCRYRRIRETLFDKPDFEQRPTVLCS